MGLYRTEYNIETGEILEVAQRAYQNALDATDVLVLDAEESTPKGYTKLTEKQFNDFKKKELEDILSKEEE